MHTETSFAQQNSEMRPLRLGAISSSHRVSEKANLNNTDRNKRMITVVEKRGKKNTGTGS
jgi:hypothetical protein